MKIVERLPAGDSSSPNQGQIRPRTMAILAGVVIAIALVTSFFVHDAVKFACFVVAGSLILWLIMISSAFAVDKRRRLRNLRGE